MTKHSPRARRSDPATSHTATRSTGDLTDTQRAVMVVLRLLGRPTTDEDLVREYQARFKSLHLPQQSQSGLRSRRSELSRAGRLVEGEKARMTTGRMGRTWSVDDSNDK